MKKFLNKNQIFWLFAITLLLILSLLLFSSLKTRRYNAVVHQESYTGSELLMTEPVNDKDKPVSISIVPRSGTWTKVFDLNHEGLSEANVQAFTYDVAVANNTKDEIAEFCLKFTFNTDTFISSAWNGSLEIHQFMDGREVVDTVPDMREFDATQHSLRTVTFDYETSLHMKQGDFLIYHPSDSMNAMEIPIEPYEGTTPGFIVYTSIGERLNCSEFSITYQFHRFLFNEPLFWLALGGLVLWFIILANYAYITAQLRKYNERHERDNEIINESIETFTGFIDAKDPYTNGHSKRVAEYTRLLAKELGFEGEELDRIYYVALLHDCGKIGVPDSILGKPGKLTDEEFQKIKSHTVKGGVVLARFKSLENAGEGALYHHERYDGKGYPEGKAGEDIPYIARIICVADSFDAMNTNRVYRKRLSKETILKELEENKGHQFDPKIADVMLRLIRTDVIPVEDP